MRKFKVSGILAMVCAAALFLGGCQNGEAAVSTTTEATTATTVAETTAADTTEDTSAETIPVQDDAVYPLSLTDKFGAEVVIEKVPEKVICFSPELVEIMYALGVGDALYGRAESCNFPEEALSVEIMGDLFNLNVETVVAAEPDLVLLSSMTSADTADSLKEKGLTVLTLDADAYFDGAYDYIAGVGMVFDAADEAAALEASMKAELQEIADKVADLEKPRAYFAVGVGEFDSTATGDTYLSQIMEMAGSVNVAKDGTFWMYTLEQLLLDDPDIILCGEMSGTKDTMLSLEGYKDLRAVKEDAVYVINDDIFYRQGPRLVEAVETLVKIFHPDAF